MLTETPEVAAALDEAAMVWPELCDDRAALLRRLVDAGREVVTARAATNRDQRRRAVRAAAGSMTGVYPPGAAESLKSEWPE